MTGGVHGSLRTGPKPRRINLIKVLTITLLGKDFHSNVPLGGCVICRVGTYSALRMLILGAACAAIWTCKYSWERCALEAATLVPGVTDFHFNSQGCVASRRSYFGVSSNFLPEPWRLWRQQMRLLTESTYNLRHAPASQPVACSECPSVACFPGGPDQTQGFAFIPFCGLRRLPSRQQNNA